MKKKIFLVIMVITMMVMFQGCGHKHSWGEWTTEKAATCTEKGVSVRRCVNCVEKETQEIPAQGHNFVNGVCTICNAKE